MLITCAQQVAVIYCESHESVAEIKAGEPAGESVRYRECRWTSTESVYRVNKTSLTKLNSAFFIRTTTINIQIFKGC